MNYPFKNSAASGSEIQDVKTICLRRFDALFIVILVAIAVGLIVFIATGLRYQTVIGRYEERSTITRAEQKVIRTQNLLNNLVFDGTNGVAKMFTEIGYDIRYVKKDSAKSAMKPLK